MIPAVCEVITFSFFFAAVNECKNYFCSYHFPSICQIDNDSRHNKNVFSFLCISFYSSLKKQQKRWINKAENGLDRKKATKEKKLSAVRKLLDPWCQFHQHCTFSFYMLKSQKRKKSLMSWLSFCSFGIRA